MLYPGVGRQFPWRNDECVRAYLLDQQPLCNLARLLGQEYDADRSVRFRWQIVDFARQGFNGFERVVHLERLRVVGRVDQCHLECFDTPGPTDLQQVAHKGRIWLPSATPVQHKEAVNGIIIQVVTQAFEVIHRLA